ncbi:MAG: aldose 1-epimerase family protein [Bacillaceae bacterium]
MIKLENNVLIAEIALHGAELKRLYNKETKIEHMWCADAAYWGRTSPVLFPIVGRLKDHVYMAKGEQYTLSQHGFARDMEFTLVKQEVDCATFVVHSTEETLKKYPYEFELQITYKLTGHTIDVIWDVKNIGAEKMYFSIGGHPAFNVPMITGTKTEDYKLRLHCGENVKTYTVDGGLISEATDILAPTEISVTPAYFKNDAVVYGNVEAISIVTDKHDHMVHVTFKDFPYVGIWSPYNEATNEIAPFICIEPWHGIADTVTSNGDFTQKMGINVLEEKETFHTVYSISVK